MDYYTAPAVNGTTGWIQMPLTTSEIERRFSNRSLLRVEHFPSFSVSVGFVRAGPCMPLLRIHLRSLTARFRTKRCSTVVPRVGSAQGSPQQILFSEASENMACDILVPYDRGLKIG